MAAHSRDRSAVHGGCSLAAAARRTAALVEMLKASASTKWAKFGPTWQKKFLLDATGDDEKRSWLDTRAKPFGIGCKACQAAGLSSRLANYKVNTVAGMQKVNSEKHHKSSSHRSACVFFLPDYVSASGVAGPAAPAAAEFEELFDNVEAGQFTCQSRRQSKMTSWLAEAVRGLDQDAVQRPLLCTAMKGQVEF